MIGLLIKIIALLLHLTKKLDFAIFNTSGGFV